MDSLSWEVFGFDPSRGLESPSTWEVHFELSRIKELAVMIEVEICASTIRDVAIAMEAGAGRVELCSVWSVGGITPNVVVVEAAASMGMSVRALIRPREGSFVHSPSERSWAAEEAKVMLDCGAERVVVGGLDSNGGLDEAYLETLVEAVGADVPQLVASGVEAVHASCRVPTSGPISPLFDTTVHSVDYDKVCDLVEAVEEANSALS